MGTPLVHEPCPEQRAALNQGVDLDVLVTFPAVCLDVEEEHL